MQYKIEVYDFEVTKDWWMCGFMDESGNYKYFDSENPLALIDYIVKHKRDTIFVGYNSFHFDRWCLKCIWYGINPWKVVDQTIIKGVAPHLIKDLQYKKNVDFMTFDLMRVLGPSAPSLKDIEANMGLPVKFDDSILNGKQEHLTKEEKEATITYNKSDCIATLSLFKELHGELDTYITLIDKLGLPIDLLNKKKSQIIEVIGKGKFKTNLTPYEYKYKTPSFIKLDDDVKNAMEQFSFTVDNTFEYELMWEGHPYNFGRGGAHYAIKNYKQDLDDNHILVLCDFASFYPGMMANPTNPELRFIDPVLDWKEFRAIVDMRLKAKASGDKQLADALKVPINSAYGKLIDPTFDYSYWPAGLNVCLTGQLITLWICKELKKINLGKLVQVNTDGFYYLVNKDELNSFEEMMINFQKIIGIDFEIDVIKSGRIVQKDVNNYVIYDKEKDHYKVKGALVRKFQTPRKYMYWSNSIIDEAIVNELVTGKLASKTIMESFMNNEANKFQLIYNVKGKNYEGAYQCWTVDGMVNKSIKTQKINRGFATVDKNCPSIRKLKGGTYHKFPDAPEHLYIYNGDMKDFDIRKISLDVQWYINLANKGIKAFLGKD